MANGTNGLNNNSKRAQARAKGPPFLEINRARPTTAVDYQDHVAKFTDFAGASVKHLLGKGQLDRAIVEYLEHIYFEGAGADSGNKLVAAIEYVEPRTRKDGPNELRRAREALRGFRRLAPGLSRAPMPLVALYALAGAALFLNEPKFAVSLGGPVAPTLS